MAGGFAGARIVLVDRSDDTFHSDGALRRRALERHGCQVTAVELTGGSMIERLRRLELPQRVERAIRSTAPDLVLVARREALDAADLGNLRGLSSARWALWTSDDMPDLGALRFVAKSYDRIFSSGTDVVQALEADFPGKSSYLPLACDPSFHRPMRARGPYRANVVFAGRATEQREMLLGGLVEYGLALWGPGWRKTLLRDYCRGELPKAEDYIRAYAGATVAINIHHSSALEPALASRGCNQRLFELAGIGALQLVDFRADLGSLFQPGEELLVYHHGDELREMVRKALYDQAYRDAIAEAGRRRALREHTYMHRMLAILTDLLPRDPEAMTEAPRVVVLTPVRNEAWILERFLQVTSRFADRIIVVDQQSTDDSRAIAARFPKVALLDNPAAGFNEAERQLLLLDAARRLVSGPRILLALDADELLAADAPASPDWRRMLTAAPGTVLGLERIDLLADETKVMRHGLWTALGYVDDGARHQPLLIHSPRIPAAEDAPVLVLPGLKVLHYALVRPGAVAAKSRWYSVLENCLGTCANPLKRRARYHDMMDFAGTARVEEVDRRWLEGWQRAGIRLRGDTEAPFYWYDDEVLRLMGQHGERKFWWDDIWDVDWEARRLDAMRRGVSGIPADVITGPSSRLRSMLRMIDPPYRAQRALRARITPRHVGERRRRRLPESAG